MWKAEEDFPRGGTPFVRSGHPRPNKETHEDQGRLGSTRPKPQGQPQGKSIFRKESDSADAPRRKKRQREDDSVQKPPVKRLREKIDTFIDPPLRQCLTTDLCVLGCVRRTQDFSVSVSLPGNRTADLPITEISESYTEQLKVLASSENLDSTEEVKPLDEMFLPGMLLPVTIKSVEQMKNNGKTRIKLTALPSVINSQLRLAALQDGMLLHGSVSSVEDHGYRIELGKKGLQAFLTSQDAKKYIDTQCNGAMLSVGDPLWCVVKLRGKSGSTEVKTRVINVSVDPDLVRQTSLGETSNLGLLLPGQTVKAVVEKKVATGLQVRVFDFEGVIHSSQLVKSPLKYKIGTEICAKVLYVHPVTKSVQLTALPHTVQYNGTPMKLFTDLKVGAILEGIVTRVEKKKGLYLSLPQHGRAFALLSQLSDASPEPDVTQFEEGQRHQCRVFGFNYMEGVALVSLKQSVLSEKFLTVEDISAGDIVEGTVKNVLPDGLCVKLSKDIVSFIPCMHLADVPIKHPEKKFEVGAKLKFRVLRVDQAKSKVNLTRKKSLLKSKYPVVTDYGQLKPRMELEGYILSVKENVVVVAFYNDVKGVVLKRDMSREEVSDPGALFYVGQVVRCRVVWYSVDDRKLRVSFNIDTNEEIPEAQFAVGQITPNVRILRLESERFRVSLGRSPKNSAVLPFQHLSDFHEIQELWKLVLRPGYVLDRVTLLHERPQKIVSMKESFLQAAQTGKLVGDFQELECGLLQPGVIKNHEEYGIFLELAGGHIGLCPAKTLTCLQPTSLQELFKPGQSVVTRLSRVDSDKQRFLGSLRLDECYEGGLDGPMTLLKNFLSQHDKVFSLLDQQGDLSSYLDVQVRELVKVTVSSVFKKGILGELASGAKALATKYHFGGIEPEMGKTYDAVVMYVDPLTPCVELTLDPKVVKAVRSRKCNEKTKLKPGQTLKADVLLVKPEFLLMAPRGHGAGQFVYVPARKHMNDVEKNPNYKVGTFSDIVIKDMCGDKQLAVLRMNDPECQARDREAASFKLLAKHNIQPGDLLDVKVKAVHQLQMNILAQGCHGRVHITEATDQPEQGSSPLQSFHPEQTVKVRVIGLRDVKSQQYLPISRPKPTRSLLECTLRQSKMESNLQDLMSTRKDLKVGDKTWVYILKATPHRVWVQAGLNQQGHVDTLHLSRQVDVVTSPHLHFLTGYAWLATVLKADHDQKMVFSFIGEDHPPEEDEEVIGQVGSVTGGECQVKLASGRKGLVTSPGDHSLQVGQYVQCTVTGQKGQVYTLAVLHSNAAHLKHRKRKRLNSVDDVLPLEPDVKTERKKKKQKNKTDKEEEEGKDSGVDVAHESTDSEKETKVAACLSVQGFSWDGTLEQGDGQESKQEMEAKDDDSDDDDDDDDTVMPESRKSKKKRKREEERQIQEFERRQLQEGGAGPGSSADFERLVLQSPNSSLVWLAFVAHHAALGELERARAVTERALATISFREEQEKQNVWLAYLNLETTYGDTADVKRVLDRAVLYNDPLNIYLKQTTIYITAGKTEEAEQLFVMLMRKYKKEKAVWKAYTDFLFKAERTQAARNLLQRCLKVLDKRDHVDVISKCAILEFSHGDPERGRTMFENLLATCPGRTDLWSVYVDMVVKAKDVEGARQLLERAVRQKLNTKKLSFLVNKYIKFEESHGTEQQVVRVKDMAMNLFDS